MIKSILKHAAAVLLGILILDVFCVWYYNPAPYQRPEVRSTDKIRRPNAWTSQAKEGVGVHIMDENGYNNPPDTYGDGISVLMMGSSHTEAFNVPTDDNASRRLEAMLRADGRTGRVYNIGVSSHTFPHNAANLPRALERFRPADYVVIETDNLMFRWRLVNNAMADSLRWLGLHASPLPEYLTDRPLLKQLYRQYWALKYRTDGIDEDDDGAAEPQDGDVVFSEDLIDRYQSSMTEWFRLLNGQAADAGVRLIIYYHPWVDLHMDGTMTFGTNDQCLAAFRQACADAGVIFIDMTEEFRRAYEEDRIVPKGFANTALGTGHLNREGHRLVAEAIYRAIREAEGGAA